MGAHATKWTLEYTLIKWEGGKKKQGTGQFPTLHAASTAYEEAKSQLFNENPRGLFYQEFTITPPKTMEGAPPRSVKEGDRRFSKRNPLNPFGKGKK